MQPKITTTKSQETLILEWLKSGKSITPLDALERFGSFRVGARIYSLRKQGWNIKTEDFKTPSGKHVAKYSLVVEAQPKLAFQSTEEFST